MSSKTALVVDDSKSARFALRKYLENHAYKVDTVDGAEEAYSFLRQNRPQVIFLDHMMPGIDGFQALEDIKNNVLIADIPVVMCSSNDTDDFRREASAKGALDVLQKPPRPDHLARILAGLPEISAAQAVLQAPTDVFDLALDVPAAAPSITPPALESMPPVIESSPAPAPMLNSVNLPPLAPSKVANIREPEVAIEQAVMKVLRGAMQARAENAAPAPAPVAPSAEINPLSTGSFSVAQTRSEPARNADAITATLREQFESRLKKVTQDLFVEIAELKAGLSHMESREESVTRPLMQEVAEASAAQLHQRIEALEQAVQTRLTEFSARIEAKLIEQADRIGRITQAAREAAAEEARSVSERTMMSAATRIADQLAQSILKAQDGSPLQAKAE